MIDKSPGADGPLAPPEEGPNRRRSLWTLVPVLALTVAILALALVGAELVAEHIGLSAGGLSQGDPVQVLARLSIMQAIVVAATLAAAYLVRAERDLALAAPADWIRTLALSLAATIALFGTIGIFIFILFRSDVMSDLGHFAPMVRSEAWPLALLAIGVGAPLSEELLFRGFVLGQLRHTALGFWGAALIATLAWTALHIGYTPVGLIEVFLAGLFFAWLLRHTGSLWVPIACHAVYNTILLLLLRYASLGVPGQAV